MAQINQTERMTPAGNVITETVITVGQPGKKPAHTVVIQEYQPGTPHATYYGRANGRLIFGRKETRG